ncbi:MAG: prolyl-tRNA synthetase associated domain-containing protein [Lachnospiraceae bacterium]|nr:prolyl-tRNA synthetase associated domain-containing protein [Lachnospiraceae bacterium]
MENQATKEWKLTSGRPVDTSARLPKEIRVYDMLDRLGVEYEYVDHPAAMTMEDCLAVDRILDAVICKNLFLCNTQKTRFYLLMMPGDKKFRTKELSEQIGSARLSFAPEEFMEELLDITPGSVSVMGLMNDHDNRVQLLMDEDVVKGEYFGCHPCINTSSLRLKMSDLMEKILKEVHHEPIFVTLEW